MSSPLSISSILLFLLHLPSSILFFFLLLLPHEDPKKPGKLSRHGLQMSCSKCGLVGHNSRKCPYKDTVNVNPPPPKRGRGRPRKNVGYKKIDLFYRVGISSEPSLKADEQDKDNLRIKIQRVISSAQS